MLMDVFAALIGWLAGAVINYLADVLPWRRRLVAPFCVHCQAPFPVGNYFLWPRRCPTCGRGRGLRAWLVEIAAIVLTVWMWRVPPVELGFWLGMLVLVFFGVVVVIDLEHRLILHPVSIVGAVLGLGLGWYVHGLPRTLIGGGFGFVVMGLFYFLGEQIVKLVARRRGQSTEEVALGFGDVNLSGVLGLMLGWPGILVGLVLGVFIGGAVSLVYILGMALARRYRLFTAIPYGPFLIMGAVLLIYFHEAVLRLLGGS